MGYQRAIFGENEEIVDFLSKEGCIL